MKIPAIEQGPLQERDLTPEAFDLKPLDQYGTEELYTLLQATVCYAGELQKAKKYTRCEDSHRRADQMCQQLDVWAYRIRDAYKVAVREAFQQDRINFSKP